MPNIGKINLLSFKNISRPNLVSFRGNSLFSVNSYKILSKNDIKKYDQKYNDVFKNLSYDQQIGILTYTYRSGSINETVSGRVDIKTIWHQDIGYFIKNLDSVLAENSVEENLVVYRGANKKYLGELQQNGIINAKNYWSTSLDNKVAQEFLNQDRNLGEGIMLKILVKEGTPSYYVGLNTGWEYQSELILPKDMKYRVLKVGKDSAVLETLS